MAEIYHVGTLDLRLYRIIAPSLQTSEVIITEERIGHIRERHPNDYERFMSYFPRIIQEPDYIVQTKKPATAVILKEIEENGQKFKLILRLKIETDPKTYKNSIISFWHIGETTWNKTLKNKLILYKRKETTYNIGRER